MDYKISNFSLVHKALQVLCKRLDCDFIDLPVRFEEVDSPSFDKRGIVIKKGKSVLDTMVYIYSAYVNAMGAICGRNIDTLEARHSLTNLFIAMLRDFRTEYGSKSAFNSDDTFLMKLDQFPVVWLLLKNIFCPYKNLPLTNARVVATSASDHDVAIYVKEGDKIENADEYPCIFVNLDIEKNAVRSAFLLAEALRLHMDEKESPEALIREVFSNFFMRDRLIDFLGMAFINDDEVSNFLAVLSILCQSKEIEDIAMGVKKLGDVKTAQANPYVGNWWFLGLHEKMLDSVRGPDWSTSVALKNFNQELWDKVEDERKRRGMSELPFELLLRVQSEGLQTTPNQTMQELLSKTRIW